MTWEYQIINDWEDDNPDSEFDLNELGKDGWELVCVRPMRLGMKWYFKRNKVVEHGKGCMLVARFIPPRASGEGKVGRMIFAYLVERGLTQKKFATKAGVSQPTISRIITGDIKSINSRTLSRLANALDVSVEDFSPP